MMIPCAIQFSPRTTAIFTASSLEEVDQYSRIIQAISHDIDQLTAAAIRRELATAENPRSRIKSRWESRALVKKKKEIRKRLPIAVTFV